MFHKVIVHEQQSPSKESLRLYNSLHLVSDEAISTDVVGTYNSTEIIRNAQFPGEWATIERDKLAWHFNPNWLPERQLGIPIDSFPMPPNAREVNNWAVISSDKETQSLVLEKQGLTSQNAILLLASSGIDICLPNVNLDLLCIADVHFIRDKLAEERKEYIEAVTRLADEAYDRLIQGGLSDIDNWARNEVFFKILPRSLELERTIEKLDRSLVKRISVGFFKEGIPSIGKSMVDDGFGKAIGTSAIEFLKIAATSLIKSSEEKRIPEANYIFKISKAIKRP